MDNFTKYILLSEKLEKEKYSEGLMQNLGQVAGKVKNAITGVKGDFQAGMNAETNAVSQLCQQFVKMIGQSNLQALQTGNYSSMEDENARKSPGQAAADKAKGIITQNNQDIKNNQQVNSSVAKINNSNEKTDSKIKADNEGSTKKINPRQQAVSNGEKVNSIGQKIDTNGQFLSPKNTISGVKNGQQ